MNGLPIQRFFRLALLSSFLTACDNPVTSDDVGWMRATITDATEIQFDGSGFFEEQAARDEPIQVPIRFRIFSSDTDGSLSQELLVLRSGAAAPAPGVYPLGPLEDRNGLLQGFTVYYSRRVDGKSESFTALSGELEIASRSGARIEGTFRLFGTRYCLLYDQGTHDDQFCGDPNTIYPDEPQVEVVGSFAATPSPDGVVNEH